jgi:hypothetical protein
VDAAAEAEVGHAWPGGVGTIRPSEDLGTTVARGDDPAGDRPGSATTSSRCSRCSVDARTVVDTTCSGSSGPPAMASSVSARTASVGVPESAHAEIIDEFGCRR